MSITLITPPAYEPVSVDELKTHLRISHTDDDVDLFTRIKLAREAVEAFTNRRLITQTWDWRLDAFPCYFLVPTPPLQSVTSIKYRDSDGAEQTLSASVYDVDIYSAPARIMEAYGQAWPVTREMMNAVTVRLVCGYGLPVDVPKSLRNAVMMIAGHYYENRENTSMLTINEVPQAAQHLMWNYRIRTYW
jgi:uncharacterized phiE125 gp8 family phage protein